MYVLSTAPVVLFLVLLVIAGEARNSFPSNTTSASISQTAATTTPTVSDSKTKTESARTPSNTGGTPTSSKSTTNDFSRTKTDSDTPTATDTPTGATASSTRSLSETMTTSKETESATNTQTASSSHSRTMTASVSASETNSKSRSESKSEGTPTSSKSIGSLTGSHNPTGTKSYPLTRSQTFSASHSLGSITFWPQHATNYSTNYLGTEITFLGGKNGDRVFVVHRDLAHALNCSSAESRIIRVLAASTSGEDYLFYSNNVHQTPQISSGRRISPVQTITNGASSIRFVTLGYEPGVYTVCYQRFGAATFEALSPTLTISGPISPHHSSVCCESGPFVVGTNVTCTIYAYDRNGLLTGSRFMDECAFSFCTAADGDGEPLRRAPSRPVLVSPGRFQFTLVGYRSGCLGTIGVAFDGMVLQNKLALLTFVAGEVDTAQATSECSAEDEGTASGNIMTCEVTRRDRFGNAVDICVADYRQGAAVQTSCRKV